MAFTNKFFFQLIFKKLSLIVGQIKGFFYYIKVIKLNPGLLFKQSNYTIRRGIQSQVEWHKDQTLMI